MPIDGGWEFGCVWQNAKQHPPFSRSSLEKMYTGRGRDNKKVLGDIAGFFLLGFGCDFAEWVIISRLRVLSDS